jgi:hypothetical protein
MLIVLVMRELPRETPPQMEKRQIVSILTTLLLFAMVASGMTSCQQQVQTVLPHKVVVTGNQHSVPVYPDEEAYLHTARMKGEGGVAGIVGDVKQKFQAKEIEDQTPVQIVSADDNGAVIAVTDGPMKGLTGFVSKQNIN